MKVVFRGRQKRWTQAQLPMGYECTQGVVKVAAVAVVAIAKKVVVLLTEVSSPLCALTGRKNLLGGSVPGSPLQVFPHSIKYLTPDP